MGMPGPPPEPPTIPTDTTDSLPDAQWFASFRIAPQLGPKSGSPAEHVGVTDSAHRKNCWAGGQLAEFPNFTQLAVQSLELSFEQPA